MKKTGIGQSRLNPVPVHNAKLQNIILSHIPHIKHKKHLTK